MNGIKSLDNKAIGRRLEDLRRSKKSIKDSKYSSSSEMSQDELIQELGLDCSQTTISRWEHGECSISIDAIYKYSQYFGVSIDYILTSKEFKVSKDSSSLIKNPSNLSDLYKILIEFMNVTPFDQFQLMSNRQNIKMSLENLYGEDKAKQILDNMEDFIKANNIQKKQDFLLACLMTKYTPENMSDASDSFIHVPPHFDDYEQIVIDYEVNFKKTILITFLCRLTKIMRLNKSVKKQYSGVDLTKLWLNRHFDLASEYSIYGASLPESQNKPYKLLEIIERNIADYVGFEVDEEGFSFKPKISFEDACSNMINEPDE